MSDFTKVSVRQGQWRAKTCVSWLRGVEIVQSLPSLMSVCVHVRTQCHAIRTTFRFVVPEKVL